MYLFFVVPSQTEKKTQSKRYYQWSSSDDKAFCGSDPDAHALYHFGQ